MVRHSARMSIMAGLVAAIAAAAPLAAQGGGGGGMPPGGGMGGGMGGGRGGMGRGGMMGGPGGPGGGRMAERMQEMLFKGITLTDAQKTQIDALNKQFHATMDSTMKADHDNNVDPQTARASMKPMMDKHLADIRAVLTADQQTTFDANVKEMQDNMQKRMQGWRNRGSGDGQQPPPPPPPQQ